MASKDQQHLHLNPFTLSFCSGIFFKIKKILFVAFPPTSSYHKAYAFQADRFCFGFFFPDRDRAFHRNLEHEFLAERRAELLL